MSNFTANESSIMRCISVFLLIIVSGCMSLAKTINGEKKPKVETIQSLNEFLNENDIDFDAETSFFVMNERSLNVLAQVRGYEWLSHPDTYLFNKNHYLVDDNLFGGCVVNRPEIEDKNFYDAIFEANQELATGFHFSSLDGIFVNHNGEPVNLLESTEGFDAAVVLWSKYKGKKWAKSHIKYNKKLLDDAKTEIKVIYLNLDPQEFWGA